MKKDNPKYPAATMAFYGPDDQHATKVVVANVSTPNSDPDPMRKWTSILTDVRTDKEIGNEVAAFLRNHGVGGARTGAADRDAGL